MNRNEVIKFLEISENTFRKWCRAWDIPTNKPEYTDDDLAKLQECKDAMASGMKWSEFLETLGKAPQQQSFSSGLVARYSPEIEKTADAISEGLLQALDLAVSEKFAKKLSRPSSIFSNFLSNVSAAPIVPALSNSDALYYLEGEILEDDLGEIPEAG